MPLPTGTAPVFFDLITIDAVNAALVHAQVKHGWHNTPLNPRRHDRDNLPILVEEIGEVARCLTYDQPELGKEAAVKELLQLAAMALAWVEGLDQRGALSPQPEEAD